MTAKQILTETAKSRRTLWGLGKGRKDCTEQEVRSIENASTFSEDNAMKWLMDNQELVYKVCNSNNCKLKATIFNL